MKRPKSEPIDPTPPMPRGENDFEEALIKRDFLSVFARISNALFNSHQQTHEYAYRAGYIAGKSKRDLNSPTSSIGDSNFNASVRETAGATKEHNNGTTKSD